MALPVTGALVADLSPQDLRGRYQGVYSFSWGLGMLLAPVAGASALARFGASGLWAGCLGMGLVVAASHLGFASWRRRELALRRAI